jgi:predicted nucleotidyltransferase
MKRAKAGHQHQQLRSQQASQQASQQQQQQQQQQPRRQAADTVPWLNTLSDDILQFTQQALPSPQEDQQRQTVLSSFEGVVNSVIGRKGVNVMLFGSARAGLALHSSDLDVMITGESPAHRSVGIGRDQLAFVHPHHMHVVRREPVHEGIRLCAIYSGGQRMHYRQAGSCSRRSC